MLTVNYNYQETLAASAKANWRIEDIIGGNKNLDFTKPFMPESLARVESLDFLSKEEKILLNQIRAYGYLYTFGMVEEFILPFVLDHARPHLNEDDYRTRALLQFASEEAKHIHLFKKFAEEFEAGFVTNCDTIGPPEEIGKAVLVHSPLGVALVILGIEWMTQKHYLESVRDDEDLDPQFKSLLRHHWMEEAQHTKLDTLMVQALTDNRSAIEIEKGISDYAAIGALIDSGISQQVKFDMQALQRAAGRNFSKPEEEQFRAIQRQALRWTYLGSAMTHPQFLQIVGEISPDARTQIEEMSKAFC
ncbi:MAG TPA: diiron oxygenase [Pyrinomonadaceae bacterium]|nr:diiron oxygenase [Pyrinomonadaceae bacterium]